ncbi:MAG: acetate/propionate family kinase [Myxococcota bacterium]|nr:acetate/propionate family kinase [Myxococcota bacterium]
MRDVILVLNSGSSSLKFSVYDGAQWVSGLDSERLQEPFFRGRVEGMPAAPRWVCLRDGEVLEEKSLGGGQGESAWDHPRSLDLILDQIALHCPGSKVRAVGHRIVHGGTRFVEPVAIDETVLDALRELVPLAPRHQPHGLAAIESMSRLQPDLLQVACFDTAFHRTQADWAQRFPLPRQLQEDHGVRRYGFHGLSYESVVNRLPEKLGSAADGRVVIGHLGSGASLAAVSKRRCIATSMGLTPLDGLMMGTRPGALDPGVMLYLMREQGYDEPKLSRLLHDESGLLGVSGLSSDMRTLLASSSPEAREAIDLFVYRAAQEIASMIVALGGLDALVFTGGVGENSAFLREAVCARLSWLGIELNEEGNRQNAPCVSSARSAISVWVTPTQEEEVIAAHTGAILRDSLRAFASRNESLRDS